MIIIVDFFENSMQFDPKSLHLEANFDNFLQNNIFMQGNRTFKKHHPLIFHILTASREFFQFSAK